MSLVVQVIQIALRILVWLIIADVIINYIPSISRYHPIVILIRKITRPVLSPFRKILPPMRIGDAYVDFSPILAIIVINIIQWILLRFL
jgi:YggT family protein